MSRPIIFALMIVASFTCLKLAAMDNWPQWRGPDGTGVAAQGKYPIAFSDSENVRWKEELPGRGSSTPAVWGDRIFVTCDIDGEDGICAYDFDGLKIWQRHLGKGREGKHRHGTGSNPSPATDGKFVVAYFKSGTLACLDFSGEKRWDVNLQELYGEDTLWWDLGTSPVLAAGKAVVAVMQEGNSYMVAYDLQSGDLAWKKPRKYKTTVESDHSYSTPCVVKNSDGEFLITWGADHLTAHDAESGELVWECDGFNPDEAPNWRVIASPAVDDEFAVVPYGRGEFLAGVHFGVNEGTPFSERIWEKQGLGADVPTPAIQGYRIYLLTDQGKVICLDKRTGVDIWSGDLPRARAKYYASPVLAGDLLYCAREDGVVMVARIGEGLELLEENNLGEGVIATPVPLRGQLLVRGEKHLFMFGR